MRARPQRVRSGGNGDFLPILKATPGIKLEVHPAMGQVPHLLKEIKERVASGDRVLVTAGVPFDVPGTTNLLRVEVV